MTELSMVIKSAQWLANQRQETMYIILKDGIYLVASGIMIRGVYKDCLVFEIVRPE